MSRQPRNPIRDLRGAARLAAAGSTAVAEVVEAVHSAVTGSWVGNTRLPTSGLVYQSIRDITRIAGAGIDRTLAPLEMLVAESRPGTTRAAVIAVLNGVVGDHLADTDNPLAVAMRFCRAGEPLDLDPVSLRSAVPDLGGKILVLVHGLCGNDRDWARDGGDYGEALARDLGYTPIYLNYNTGRHISENGREFSRLLEQLVQAWPVAVDELVLLCHSMGGLVARSACHYSDPASRWRPRLTKLVSLGTPHHGAALERGGNGLQWLAGVNRYSAPLGRLAKLRSAGITDLRYGAFLDGHWAGYDRFAPTGDTRDAVDLPTGVACYALAGTMSIRGRRHPLGDGMVTVASALGHHRDPRRALGFPAENTHVVTQTGHVELLGNAEVYETLKSWLAAPV